MLLAADELLLVGIVARRHGLGLLAAAQLVEQQVDGLDHRGGRGGRRRGHDDQPLVVGRAERGVAEDGYRGERRAVELGHQRLHVGRRIEGQQVVVRGRELVQIGGYRARQDHRVDRQLELGQCLGKLGLVRLAQREQELLLLVLDDELDERIESTVGERDLALAVDDVLLQVERHGLGLADVLHGLGDRDAGLLADVEEAVDGGARGENHGRVGQNLHPLRTELLERYALDADEGLVGDLDTTTA